MPRITPSPGNKPVNQTHEVKSTPSSAETIPSAAIMPALASGIHKSPTVEISSTLLSRDNIGNEKLVLAWAAAVTVSVIAGVEGVSGGRPELIAASIGSFAIFLLLLKELVSRSVEDYEAYQSKIAQTAPQPQKKEAEQPKEFTQGQEIFYEMFLKPVADLSNAITVISQRGVVSEDDLSSRGTYHTTDGNKRSEKP